MLFRSWTSIFALLMFISCGKSGGGSSSSPVSKGASVTEQVSVEAPVPSDALSFDVNLKLENFNSHQEDKVLSAADLIKKVITSEEFKNAVLNHKYRGKKAFADNQGMSNEEIYKTIIEGSENLIPGADNEMDLELELFSRSDDTVGYTYPNEIKVWMNAKFLNKNTPAKVTTNMMHEWLHKLGFEHSVTRTPSRPFSVPYAVGYLVARLAEKMD